VATWSQPRRTVARCPTTITVQPLVPERRPPRGLARPRDRGIGSARRSDACL